MTSQEHYPNGDVVEHYRFGDALPESGLVGYLIKAEPELGCQPIKPPPVDSSHLPLGVHWIAIIRDNVRW